MQFLANVGICSAPTPTAPNERGSSRPAINSSSTCEAVRPGAPWTQPRSFTDALNASTNGNMTQRYSHAGHWPAAEDMSYGVARAQAGTRHDTYHGHPGAHQALQAGVQVSRVRFDSR